MPDQNQASNVDSAMPEKGKQVPDRRRLLRNIVAVGALGFAVIIILMMGRMGIKI